MTSYFDDAEREVREVSEWDDEDFLDLVAQVEDGVVREVNLVTGDREFPDDLREKIQGIIAVWRVEGPEGCPPTQGRQHTLISRSSSLLSELHRAFHEVGRRRIKTRFGLLTDNPRVALTARDDHDG